MHYLWLSCDPLDFGNEKNIMIPPNFLSNYDPQCIWDTPAEENDIPLSIVLIGLESYDLTK